MLGLQIFPVVAEGDPGLVVGEVLQGQVGGVAAVGGDQGEAGAGLHAVEQGVPATPPSQVVARLDQWVTQWRSTVTCSLGRAPEGIPVPAPLLVGLAGDDELPVLQIDAGRRSGRQDREVLDQVLAQGQLDAGAPPPRNPRDTVLIVRLPVV
jgi:hypothetical protein